MTRTPSPETPVSEQTRDYGESEAFHEGVKLTCKNVAPNLTMNDIAKVFERAKSEAQPGDEFAGDPSKWPDIRGLTAVVVLLADAFTAPTPSSDVSSLIEGVISVETVEAAWREYAKRYKAGGGRIFPDDLRGIISAAIAAHNTETAKELDRLRQWADGPSGVKWHVERTKALADENKQLRTKQAETAIVLKRVSYAAASLLRVTDNHARDIAEPIFREERDELRAALKTGA
jgi:hypothetical protein